MQLELRLITEEYEDCYPLRQQRTAVLKMLKDCYLIDLLTQQKYS